MGPANLARAGVNVDLAPVTDVVPGDPTKNPPIGYFHREYGRTAGAVERAVSAVVPGYTSAGVAATLKHFPGLGKVTANTDTTANVVDRVTQRSALTEGPWRSGIAAGAGLVMISSAHYARIDAHHIAAFSPIVITGMLRDDLGYTGVVISDDLGNAVAVAAVEPGQRAVSFITAGGDVVLTVNAALVPPDDPGDHRPRRLHALLPGPGAGERAAHPDPQGPDGTAAVTVAAPPVRCGRAAAGSRRGWRVLRRSTARTRRRGHRP